MAGAGLAGCARKLGKRYNGWLLVASGEEKALAVADLSREFRPMTKIALPMAPDQLFQAGEQGVRAVPRGRGTDRDQPE